jgi:lipoprotein-anchoring transpeptidase ErfK/SrfK
MVGVTGAVSSTTTLRFWQLAILTAAGAIGTPSKAEAALYYWPDYADGSYYVRQQRPAMERPKARKRGSAAKKAVAEKETGAKPQGPLVIVVSIERQKVTIFDANGAFAESPVSTGMMGHATPMGVFSVIQKHKFHHSNIYSGAPMPYMQRITWSGVAMHAGVLPGYPASHGCIRMPMAFAVKMWNWTRMGARVIVTPGTISPHSFSHPLLASVRVPPQPAASLAPSPTNAADKADKGAPETRTAEASPVEIKSASADPVIELRSTLGHSVMSDAPIGNAMARDDAPADATAATIEEVKAETTKTAEAKPDEIKPAGARQAEAAETPKATADEKPAAAIEAPKADAAKAEPAKSDPAKAEAPDAKKDQTRIADPAPAAKPEAPKRAGQIAVFISRKDSKLYVRQNFAPLFEAPVTIAVSDRPLGTHVFTAELDKTDGNALRWSVVSLPVAMRSASRAAEAPTMHRSRVAGAAVIPAAAKPAITPDSPAEALDRISVPADTMAQINEMLTTGASIIVSDQGINQGETGEGTDFIVRLR